MDRRIFFALAAIAGVVAAIVLLPSREKEDADVGVGHEQASAGKDAQLKHKGKGKRKRQGAAAGTDDEGDPAAKAAARAANAERRATPYFQHVKAVAKRWLVLANTLGPAGQQDLAAEMRTVSRELRKASLPDATEEDKRAALDHESRMLTTLRGMELDGELVQVRDYLEEAFRAVSAGEQPPKTGDAETPPTEGTPAATGAPAVAPADAPATDAPPPEGATVP